MARVYIPPEVFIKSRKTQDTRDTYEKTLVLFSKWKFNSTDLTAKGPLGAYVKKGNRSDILTDLLLYSKYLEEPRMLANGGRKYQLSKASRKAYLMGVKAYLTTNEIVFNKGQLGPVNVKNDDEVMDIPFTHESAKAIFDQLTIPARAVFLFLLASGTRINECLSVNIDDVEWNSKPCKVHLKITKGGRPRDVYITDECRDYLQSVWLAPVKNKKGELLPRRDQYLISKENKGFIKYRDPIPKENDKRLFPLTRNTFQNMLRRALINKGYTETTPTGIMKLHVHSTRKFFRSQVGRWGSPDVAEHLLGHTYGLQGTYRKFDKDDPQLIADYQKSMPYLTLGLTQEARQAISTRDMHAVAIVGLQEENKQLKNEVEKIRKAAVYSKTLDGQAGNLTPKELEQIAALVIKMQREQKS